MKTFEEIESKLSSLKSTNLTDIEKYQENIVKAKQALKIANEELTTAEETADIEAYNKAKDDIWSSQHAIELYQKQLDKLQNTPLVPKAEYNQLVSDIEKTADKLQDELNIKGAELVAELKALAEESTKAQDKANEFLRVAQYDIYKDADCLVVSNGTRITRAVEYNKVDTVKNFYQMQHLANSYLDKMNGDNPQPKTTVFWGQ